MSQDCSYTFKHYKNMIEKGLSQGYIFKTCQQYSKNKNVQPKICVMRHDIDLSPERAIEFAKIEINLGITSTYFFRIHANEYNCLGYEILSLIKDLDAMGHEIGLHAEPLDIYRATGLESKQSIKIGKRILEDILGHEIEGIASHRDPTVDNNLHFFNSNSASSLGFLYEAYDNVKLNLFPSSTYVTDGHVSYWRTFINGKRINSEACLCNHFENNIPLIYCLTHPHVWYHRHYHRINY